MTLPATPPISLSQIAAEFGVGLPCVFPDAFYGKPGIPASGPLSFSQFCGQSAVTFSPDGGTINEDTYLSCSTTIYCSIPAVWTFGGGGTGGFVDQAYGASSTSITFTCNAGGSPTHWFTRSLAWSLTGIAGGITRNFTIYLTAEGDF